MSSFTVNGKRIYFEQAQAYWKPLSEWPLGDLQALEQLGVKIVGRTVEALSVTEGVAILYHLARKCNRAVTKADFDALTITDIQPMLAFIGEKLMPPEPESEDGPAPAEAQGDQKSGSDMDPLAES